MCNYNRYTRDYNRYTRDYLEITMCCMHTSHRVLIFQMYSLSVDKVAMLLHKPKDKT